MAMAHGGCFECVQMQVLSLPPPLSLIFFLVFHRPARPFTVRSFVQLRGARASSAICREIKHGPPGSDVEKRVARKKSRPNEQNSLSHVEASHRLLPPLFT